MFSLNGINNRLTQNIAILATSSVVFLGSSILFPAMGLTKPSQLLLAQNTYIRTTSAQNDTLYLNNDRTYSYNLTVTRGGSIDGYFIPRGATIIGRYEPAEGGLRYVARAAVFNGRRYPISVASEVLEDVKDPRDTSAGSVAEDAGIGAAAGTILGEVFGDEANIEEIIGGAAAGAAVGNITADRVVVVEPDEPIVLYNN